MQVVLLERVEKLGQMGDVVKVKDGFARNFLLPRSKALRATKENLKQFEERRAQLEAQNLEQKQEAGTVGETLNGQAYIAIRQSSEAGQLYGSVTTRDIATLVTEGGVTVHRTQVVLEKPIKDLGLHEVRIVLHPEVSATVTINVARSEEEAERQARGEDVTLRAEDDDFDEDEFFEDDEDGEGDEGEDTAEGEGTPGEETATDDPAGEADGDEDPKA